MTAVRLTSPGRGAVASIRLSCQSPDQAAAISDCFVAVNGILPSTAPINRVLFGSWRGEDVIVVRTDELNWEVHCHGGEAAVTRILSEFSQPKKPTAGSETSCNLLSPLDALLLRTRTPKTARLALAQANGVLNRALQNIVHASNEAEFRTHVAELLRWESVARHLDEPWRIVIAGPPNVGKSSLLNAIAGYERTIVYDQPGTTRDAVQTDLVIDGWPFCFIDTAGIRQESSDPIERQGIENSQQQLANSDLVLVAVDRSIGWQAEQDQMLALIPESVPQAAVVCKSDQAAAGDAPPRFLTVHDTSALRSSGIEALTTWIIRQLIPVEPTLETALPIAGTADRCRSLLHDLDSGIDLPTVRSGFQLL